MPLRQLHFCHRKFHPENSGRCQGYRGGPTNIRAYHNFRSCQTDITALLSRPLGNIYIYRKKCGSKIVGWLIQNVYCFSRFPYRYTFYILYMYRVYIPFELMASMRVEGWSWWIEGMGANEHEGGLANNRCLFGDYWILYYHGCGSQQSHKMICIFFVSLQSGCCL